MSDFLYRLRNVKGDLLYVGITQDWPTRMKQHQADKPWWSEVMSVELVRLDCSRTQTETIEKAVIKAEQPTYNVVHNGETRAKLGAQAVPWRQSYTRSYFDDTYGSVTVLTEKTPTRNADAWLDDKVKHPAFGIGTSFDRCVRDGIRYLVVQADDTRALWLVDCERTAYEVVAP